MPLKSGGTLQSASLREKQQLRKFILSKVKDY
jgi:hypothetical protein